MRDGEPSRERHDGKRHDGKRHDGKRHDGKRDGNGGRSGWAARFPARGRLAVLRRTAGEFLDDELPDRAAALTYYGVLAVFPALLVLVSILGLLGGPVTGAVLDNLRQLAPGPARDVLSGSVEQLRDGRGAGGVFAAVGLLGALWSASGYVAAFIRAANAVYDIREGRPVWKLTPLRVGLTLVLMVLLLASAVIVVFTGPLAERAGDLLGIGPTAVTVWSVAKWPVLVLLVSVMIALLYWAAPNVRGRGWHWISPGSLLAVLLWLALSGGFAAYVAWFGSYNRTYGTLAGVVVFLVWLWLSNLAVLLGLEFDAELARERAVEHGLPPDAEPFLPPRDTREWPEDAAAPDTRTHRTGEQR
ncbi:YihY/virulence factor BrkB family protein [Kitasatospora setae]|uniref:Putative ribonuclease n=1 Tax=Kitasatospora setae (strain ATCC 33774 / DSM 43861 / JCM 3304 / KCC A-0304 / NBRC 14216 / KM-6054) TaxID=452652 RepID=E4N571_KITSK|nr:YihY/virulence factor BrkB family protein [Kitasatospora setae]BAJ26352.1 putative ribonuclease [Kitasatospora setae KM-6054]